NAEFVFIEYPSHSKEVAYLFKVRISYAFKQHNLDPNRYIRLVPSQDFQDFLRLLSLSDVYLDSIGWSGGMTTLEALGSMLPIVTMPGRFLRGRHSYGCLKRIGVTETVVRSVEDYVNVSAGLGLDEKWREAIKLRQASNLDRLYNDRDCILA